MNSPRLWIVLGGAAALAGCTQSLKLSPDDSKTVLANQRIAASDPGEPGPFAVRYLTYGHGNDKRRAAYRDSVAFRTNTVDASPFVKMPPDEARRRKDTWGFDIKHAPLNGRVWYPDGPGPFPLVVIAHTRLPCMRALKSRPSTRIQALQ